MILPIQYVKVVILFDNKFVISPVRPVNLMGFLNVLHVLD